MHSVPPQLSSRSPTNADTPRLSSRSRNSSETMSSSSNSNSPAPIEQSRRFTRELHSRLVHRFPALFADLTPGAVVRHPHLPFSLSPSVSFSRSPVVQWKQVPTPQGTPSYGATNGAPMGDGLQKLGADASKIEPKVRGGRPCCFSPSPPC